jgi:hypothetical protein
MKKITIASCLSLILAVGLIAQDGAQTNIGAGLNSAFAPYIGPSGTALGSITIPAVSSYGFAGSSNAIKLTGTATCVTGPDGGCYFYVTNGQVTVNSANIALASGGSLYSLISLPSASVGLFNLTNAANTAGVGLDVSTDTLMKIRTRAQTGDASVSAAYHSSSASSILSITSNVITPTGSVHHLNAGLVKTITVPAGCSATCSIDIVPDAAFTTDATGNISLASTGVINKTLRFTYDGTKWNPSY